MTNILRVTLILIIFSLASCTKGEKEPKAAREIMKDYTKTLSTAPEKARDVSAETDERNTEMTDTLKELDK